jgi:hypothetical protein
MATATVTLNDQASRDKADILRVIEAANKAIPCERFASGHGKVQPGASQPSALPSPQPQPSR